MLLKEELHWKDKGNVPFIGWSMDVVGPFLCDKVGNHYPLVAMDQFFKWLETCTMSLLHI